MSIHQAVRRNTPLWTLVWLVVFYTHPSFAQKPNTIRQTLKSVAYVEVMDEDGSVAGHCTAFSPIITLWVTKRHCGYNLRINGQALEFVREDEENDLLLMVGPVVPPVNVAQTDVDLGEAVYIAGWPLDWDDPHPFVGFGRVSATNVHPLVDGSSVQALNAIDGTAAPGMSGAPIINTNGEVVGVFDSISIDFRMRQVAYSTALKQLRKFLGLKG